ncbi:MAG: hypothetical protein ABH950_07385 [Candidatus Altiarchaeota archaeon]
MVSNFEINYTQFFEKQWISFDEKTQQRIKEKLKLIKNNPFRYPTHKGYKRVHKVKLSIKGKYQRLIYAVHNPQAYNILVLGIFSRDKDYQDFERKFANL